LATYLPSCVVVVALDWARQRKATPELRRFDIEIFMVD